MMTYAPSAYTHIHAHTGPCRTLCDLPCDSVTLAWFASATCPACLEREVSA